MRKSFKKTLLQMTAIGTALGVMGPIPAFAQLDEIVVTAQKREESIMSVPIAVTAFDTAALDRLQIDTFSDLQFNVPNVSFSKTNFSGSNFQIRGIGTLLTAASGDSGVGMHINDVYLNAPKVFETEYYDMDQLELLRGPQGTLFGRNATGGAVNMKTKRPVMDEVSAGGEIQYGNYNHKKAKGFVNLPLVDGVAAARIAAVFLDRDGYTTNDFTGNDIDDREQWSVRGSLQITPNDRTTIDLMAYYFQEDSTRLRGVKQYCDHDASGILGCLPTTRGMQTSNPFASAGPLLSSNLVLADIPDLPGGLDGVISLFNFFTDPNGGDPINPDARHVSTQFEPTYDADEIFVMAEVNHELNEDLTLTLLAGYQETSTISRQSYYDGIGLPATLPLTTDVLFPGIGAFFGIGAGGPIPQSDVPIDASHTSLGAMGGDFELSNNSNARDLSLVNANQWNVEARVVSDLDGRINFQASAFYMDFQSDNNYFVQAISLEYPALLFAADPTLGASSFNIVGPGFFDSETDRYGLESWAIAGEVYVDIVPDVIKLTGGMRYTTDKKSLRDRGRFLNIGANVDVATGGITILGDPSGTVYGNNAKAFYAGAAALGLFDADPNLDGSQAYRNKSVKFDELTGRLVLDWTPTDDTLFYVSYSRGYKGGGINPPIDTNLFPDTVEAFDSEIIDAYELGMKASFLDNTLRFTGAAFYYDYGGLQIGKIENRTSINENMDAKIKGVELETLWAPDEHFQFNMQVSWLDTELGDLETVDPRDPNQGRTDVTVVKDFTTAAHCVIEHGDQVAPVMNAAFMAASGGAFIPTGVDLGGGLVIPALETAAFSAFSLCSVVDALGAGFGYNVTSGVTTNLKGNELIGSPEWTVNLGGQYTFETGAGYTVMGRVDYYWQDDMWGRVFNRPGIDEIQDWSQVNLQVTVSAPEDRWFARGFIQNVGNKDNMTGMYSTAAASGFFTNAFMNEPRLYGFTLGAQF